MPQEIESNHYNDANGNPGGGYAAGTGMAIRWQDGPLKFDDGSVRAINGAFVEDVIAAALDRLQYYQGSKFACWENAEAIDYLKRALAACHLRTLNREKQGVEGTHGLHK